jgi:membrane protease YdiL (CAAX protease family)
MENKRWSAALVSTLVLLWACALVLSQYLAGLMAKYLVYGWQQYLLLAVVELGFLFIPLFIVGKLAGVKFSSALDKGFKGQGKLIGLSMGMAVFTYPVVLLIQNLWLFMLKSLGASPQNMELPPISGTLELLLAVVTIAGTAAFAEEFCLRGVLLPGLRGRMKPIWALTITSIVFTLMHGSFTALPYTFLLGWLLGYLTLRSGSIFPAMAFHFTNNAIATLLSYWATKITEVTPQLTQASQAETILAMMELAMVALPALVIFCIMIYFFRRRTPGVVPMERESGKIFLWWLPLVLGAAVLAWLVSLSAVQEFHFTGAACILTFFA